MTTPQQPHELIGQELRRLREIQERLTADFVSLQGTVDTLGRRIEVLELELFPESSTEYDYTDPPEDCQEQMDQCDLDQVIDDRDIPF